MHVKISTCRIGRIKLDDAIERIRSEAGHAMMHMAGLQGVEGLLASVASCVRRRLFWLGINLAAAFLAALVPDFLKRPAKRSWHWQY